MTLIKYIEMLLLGAANIQIIFIICDVIFILVEAFCEARTFWLTLVLNNSIK